MIRYFRIFIFGWKGGNFSPALILHRIVSLHIQTLNVFCLVSSSRVVIFHTAIVATAHSTIQCVVDGRNKKQHKQIRIIKKKKFLTRSLHRIISFCFSLRKKNDQDVSLSLFIHLFVCLFICLLHLQNWNFSRTTRQLNSHRHLSHTAIRITKRRKRNLKAGIDVTVFVEFVIIW